MAILISTTGATTSVTFSDLGGRVFTHPVVELDLNLEYTLEELRDSTDLQSAIDLGYVTIKDENDISITDVSTLDDREGLAGNITFNDLNDVDVSGESDGDVLTYNQSTGNWESKSIPLILNDTIDVYDSSGGTSSTSTSWVAVPLNTERIKDSAFSHDNVTNNSEVTINVSDRYHIIGKVSAQGASNVIRTQAEGIIQINTGGGWSDIPGTKGEMYLRQTSFGATCTMAATLLLNAGDKLRLAFRLETGGTNVTLQANGSSLVLFQTKGNKGDKGDTGSGSIIIQKDDVNVGTLTDTLNFEGSGVTSTVDEGSNKTTVTISDTDTTYTDAQIKTKYENNADTNAFTDAEKTKLTGIEVNATADQSDVEIKTAYENNADTNAFTDAEKTKLTGIESNAKDDQDAFEVPYTPSAIADWNTVPDDVKEALDEVASRVEIIETEGLNIDAQEVDASTSASTSSGTYVDMSDMTLTTNNLVSRKYLITFSGTFTGGSNKILSIQIVIDGVVSTGSVRSHKVSSNNAEFTMSTQALSDVLLTGKTIKVQWQSSGGIMNVTSRSLIMYSV